MFSNTLVVLDGAQTSEVVLQYVPSLVCSAGSKKVSLLRVYDEIEVQKGRDIDDYLADSADRLTKSWDTGLCDLPDIQTITLAGSNASSAIVGFVQENGMDIIMLATRGWSGADWWTTGSVAQQIMRRATVPVFAARLRGGRYPRPGIIKRILVPLDGSALAEQAVPYAGQLAKNASASVCLLHVEDASNPSHSTAENQPELNVSEYLNSVAAQLKGSATEVVIKAQQGHPGQRIAETAQDEKFDLITMSSHGRTGPGRGAFGGVTERVIHGCHVPLVVIPARAKPPVN